MVKPWHDYLEGLRYMRATPLFFAIAMVAVGWATGGGAAQILFSLFGELVFNRGPAGIGIIWASAGVGLLAGGAIAHTLGKRLSFAGYKRTVVVCYIIHGAAYVIFTQMQHFGAALFFIAVSRGKIYDNDALVAALKSGQVAGAGLDVTATEPLPKNHPLWKTGRVIITPHIAGRSDGEGARYFELYKDNLIRFAKGEPLRHTVDKQAGY